MPVLSKKEQTKLIMNDILSCIMERHKIPSDYILQQSRECHSSACLLETLCHMKESLIFPTHLDIIGKDNFIWYHLAEGLSSHDSLARKRANYLFKRAIDQPYVPRKQSKSSDTSSHYGEVVVLEPENFPRNKKLWETYLVVVETLEEKQVHLIKQVIGKIHQLLSEKVPRNIEELGAEKPLHIMWMLVIFKILFQHQNHAIVKWGVKAFLVNFRSGFDICGCREIADFVCKSLLNVLNSSKMFNCNGSDHFANAKKAGCETEYLLTNFFENCLPPNNVMVDDHQKYVIFWNRLLMSVFTMPWGPLPIFHVTSGLLMAVHRADLSHW